MIRILIADDHEVVRTGLKYILLAEFPDAEIAEVSNGRHLLQRALDEHWDIILSDITMPEMNGIQALQYIKSAKPAMPVLIISMQTGEQYLKKLRKAGASGYFSKGADPDELLIAVHTILRGERYFPAQRSEKFPDSTSGMPHELLSIRELEIMKLIARGKSLIDIAELLNLSPSTVSTFRARVFKKMKFTSDADLVRYAVENHLI